MKTRSNLKDEVAKHIRSMIFSGAARPGSRVDQDLIAEQTGVSRLPVREALIMLEAEGLISNRIRRGYFVAELTPADILDHFHIFGLIAGLAAERAASTMPAEELQRLRDIVTRSRAVDDPPALNELNQEFHAIINRNGGSHRLRAALGVLASSMPTSYFELAPGREGRAQQEHTRLVDALERGDGQAARELMIDHLRDSGEYAVTVLHQRGFWEPGV